MSEATALLRPGLLEGTAVLMAGSEDPADPLPAESLSAGVLSAGALSVGALSAGALSVGSLGEAARKVCTDLGARVQICTPDMSDEARVDQMVTAAVAEMGRIDLLVVDGAGLFTHGAGEGGGARGALRTCLDTAWNITRAVVNRAFLPAEQSSSPRRIVYLAPAPGAGESAGAARAGLENLSRTLSTEWARHGITVVTIAPGDSTAAGEVATLCAYLASPAGAYFSGCLLDLRGVEER